EGHGQRRRRTGVDREEQRPAEQERGERAERLAHVDVTAPRIRQHCPERTKGELTEQREHAAHDPHDESEAHVTDRLPQHGSGHGKDARADCGADHDEDEVAQREDTGEIPRAGAQRRAATAAATSRVPALPPMSGVRTPAVSVSFTARSRSRAASGAPSCSSISAPASTAAMGLAIPLPASGGAEPCTGSNSPAPPRPGWIFALAASPRPRYTPSVFSRKITKSIRRPRPRRGVRSGWNSVTGRKLTYRSSRNRSPSRMSRACSLPGTRGSPIAPSKMASASSRR